MNKVKEFFKKKRAILYAALALLLVAAISAGFGISAKYRKDISIPGKLIIDAGLAKSIAILEHEAVRADDGTYSLNTGKVVSKNEFTVLPKVGLPRDPFVRIEEKTEVPAYLYIEVVKSGSLTFTLTDDWKILEGKIGKNDGQIYSYKNAAITSAEGDIAILTGNVSADDVAGELSFYPYMVKAESGSDAAGSFDDKFISSGTVGTYTPAVPGDPKVVRETDGTVDVDPNNEDHSVYVRATVVVNWKMADGVVYAKKVVEGVDYRFNTDDKWFCCDSDGFYYYTDPVAEGETASDLVKLFSAIGEAPEGCTLSVTVVTQTIQAAGGAVTTEWGCTVNDDGTISKN